MKAPDVIFAAAVELAYRQTREQFERWAMLPSHRNYVVAEAMEPNAGFAIFYTPPRHKPPLAIVGQNPSNFAGAGRSLSEKPNAEMLCGAPPTHSSYENHHHVFAQAIREGFIGYDNLYRASVGMNAWHFQCLRNADKAPRDLQTFCEATTRNLIHAMEPANVLCFGRVAFAALAGRGRPVDGARKAEVSKIGETAYWMVPHLTSVYTRIDAQHDLPLVLEAISSELADRGRGSHRPEASPNNPRPAR